MYKVVSSSFAEYEEKRSQFISRCFLAESHEEVMFVCKSMREEHKDAAHVVHAFCIGEKNSMSQGMSDDGEPSGTAGRPTLDMLNWAQLTNVVLVTVRYFGGIKLGAGGLTRAYRKSAQAAIEATVKEEIIQTIVCRVELSYEDNHVFARKLQDFILYNSSEQYGETVVHSFELTEHDLQKMKRAVLECSRGLSELTII